MPKKEPDGWPRKQGNSKTNSRTTSSSTSHQHPTSFNKVIEDRWRVLGIWEMLWFPLGMEPIHLKWSKILLALWQGQVPFDRPSVRMGGFHLCSHPLLLTSIQRALRESQTADNIWTNLVVRGGMGTFEADTCWASMSSGRFTCILSHMQLRCDVLSPATTVKASVVAWFC